MSCDAHFEQCLQNKFDLILGYENRKKSHEAVSAGPHRLVGTEIWMEADGKKEIFLEGVTGIEFKEGGILLQTVLGETLSLRGALERVLLREWGLVIQTKKALTLQSKVGP